MRSGGVNDDDALALFELGDDVANPPAQNITSRFGDVPSDIISIICFVHEFDFFFSQNIKIIDQRVNFLIGGGGAF